MNKIILFILCAFFIASCSKPASRSPKVAPPVADSVRKGNAVEYIGTYTFHYSYACDPCGSRFDTVFTIPFKVSTTVVNDSIAFTTNFPKTTFRYDIPCHYNVHIEYGNILTSNWLIADSNIYEQYGERFALEGDSLNYQWKAAGMPYYPKQLKGGCVMDFIVYDVSFKGCRKSGR